MIELAKRFAEGGEEVLEEVVACFGETLLRYATAILCDYQEAEDVTQEVFLAAYQNRASFDGDNLSAWLYKIAYNRSINKVRRRKIIKITELNDKIPAPEIDTGLSDGVLKALMRLKPKERALIYGRIMEGLNYEELSNLLGDSPSALRKRYQRAKSKLASYLTEYQKGEEDSYERI